MKMRLVEPSGLVSIVIGRTPLPRLSSQAISSFCRSTTVNMLVRVEPMIANLLSGVT